MLLNGQGTQEGSPAPRDCTGSLPRKSPSLLSAMIIIFFKLENWIKDRRQWEGMRTIQNSNKYSRGGEKKANTPRKAGKQRRNSLKDGRELRLDIFLGPCGERKFIQIQSNVYGKHGSHRKIDWPQKLVKQFFPLIYLCISIVKNQCF